MHDLNKNNNLQLKKKEKEESLLVLIGCIIQQRGHCLVCMGRIKKQNNSKHSSIKPKIATKPTLQTYLIGRCYRCSPQGHCTLPQHSWRGRCSWCHQNSTGLPGTMCKLLRLPNCRCHQGNAESDNRNNNNNSDFLSGVICSINTAQHALNTPSPTFNNPYKPPHSPHTHSHTHLQTQKVLYITPN